MSNITLEQLIDMEACEVGIRDLKPVLSCTWLEAAKVSTVDNILWYLDEMDLSEQQQVALCGFARKCALDVVPLWDAPEVVVRYLKCGRGRREALVATQHFIHTHLRNVVLHNAACAARAAIRADPYGHTGVECCIAYTQTECILNLMPHLFRKQHKRLVKVIKRWER